MKLIPFVINRKCIIINIYILDRGGLASERDTLQIP